MWFDTWSQVLRVLLVGTAAYVTLVVFLRISGKRTLSKLNAFDMVVTVALGSTLATVLLNSAVSWTEGVVALALLIALQFVVAAVAAWVPGGHQALTSPARLLVRDGLMLDEALRQSRVSQDEVRQAIRSSGQGDLAEIAALVLETDGSMSVIPRSAAGDRSALRHVRGERVAPGGQQGPAA